MVVNDQFSAISLTGHWAFAKCKLNLPSPSGRGAGVRVKEKRHKQGKPFLAKSPSP